MNILFVCTGNTCRSPMAEFIANKMFEDMNMTEHFASSAGVSTTNGQRASSGSIYACSEIGIDLTPHRSAQVNEIMLEHADLILTMSITHQMLIESYFPEICKGKTYTLGEYAHMCDELILAMGVDDPYMMSNEVYVSVRKQITSYLEVIIKYLKERGDK